MAEEVITSTNESGDTGNEESSEDNSEVNEGAEETTDGGAGHSDSDTEDEEDGKTKPKVAAKKETAQELQEKELDKLVNYKVNGVVKKITVREALKLAQKGEAADKKFEESAADRKKIQEFLKFSKNDPKGYLKALGHDPIKWAIKEIDDYLLEQEMDPKDKQLRDFQLKQKEWEAKEAADKETAATEAKQKEDSEAEKTIDAKLLDAFKKSGLPNKKFYMQQMTARAIGALARDEELNFDDIADKVKSSVQSDIAELIGSMDAKAIQELLGDQIIKKITNAQIQRVTGKAPVDNSKRPGSPVPKKKNAPLNEREWDKHLESLKARSA